MVISIWRYSHLVLAISSSIFLGIASITGIILAFEPIYHAIQPYKAEDMERISVAETLEMLDGKYLEVLELKVDSDNFVQASVIGQDGESSTIYINPLTAEKIGEPQEKKAIFRFATNLHRSLFLKSPGRFFVGLVSFLLLLIAITGIILVARRQGGLKRWFTRVNKDTSGQYYHVVLGRIFLVPVIIIAGTGVYLSLEKFGLLPEAEISHQTVLAPTTKGNSAVASGPSVLKQIRLKEVRTILFPFSDNEEDYYQLELKDREILVHQYKGTVISEVEYPLIMLASRLSLAWHTGRGSVLWSAVLLASCIAIVFFMISGFAMTLRRRKHTVRLKTEAADPGKCEYVVLVGSETGSTFNMAKVLQKALIALGKSVYLSELNDYENFDRVKHLIVLTATYGHGDAPSNAQKFVEKFQATTIANPMSFSVVGLGSLAYPNYCQFAIEVDQLLGKHPKLKQALPLYKINNQSFEAFKDWSDKWAKALGLQLRLKNPGSPASTKKTTEFVVVERTEVNPDDTFLLKLKPTSNLSFSSGDLIAIKPGGNEVDRFYSIAKTDDEILLSIKKHSNGYCSRYLSGLEQGQEISAWIKPNTEFHFPSKTPEVILISNGTGIAPFLGMINNGLGATKTHLFWGGRNETSLEIYKDYIHSARHRGQLSFVFEAYSQSGLEKHYVQDLVCREADLIAKSLENGGVIMICGSVAMQKEVVRVLETISKKRLNVPLSQFLNRGKIKMDCY
ncbi:PepSY domain-containing protein [Poritiphilus flavus]|uniref:FAD-binding oxidoreductase n=1 Tax=Poritiphilus flavus TaxID=2697053 RepID=A0A6L9E8X4_9FLAO|nr:PepSY domain-containing protein [Poritiphilus flavus]NAS11227.1 FAD-binding oxidoreductase [Poritiphilus flavus]